jgi:hypothetical protein
VTPREKAVGRSTDALVRAQELARAADALEGARLKMRDAAALEVTGRQVAELREASRLALHAHAWHRATADELAAAERVDLHLQAANIVPRTQ